MPFRLLRRLKPEAEGRLIMDLSFPAPDDDGEQASDPKVNTFAYRVRYGNDSLLPVYFVELKLEKK